MKKLFIIAVIATFFITQNTKVAKADSLSSRLSGQILLQVESAGEAWYVNPNDNKRYYLGRPTDAFNVMRELGLGIKHSTLTAYLADKFPANLSGKIMLDVENNGEAYYIYPKDKKGYFLGKPADAFNVMRKMGLGISNIDLKKIVQSQQAQDKEKEEISEDQLINLINNNKWNIFIKAPEIADTSLYLYFDVTRDGEYMNIVTYKQDKNTGELKESLLDNYSVNFDNKFEAYIENGHAKYNEDMYLLIQDHWYDYPALEIGYNFKEYYIPIKIDKTEIKGILEFSSEYGDDYEDEINLEIEIKEKNNNDIKCLVKGFTKSSGKYYYTKNSKHFNYPSNFKCFFDENSATQEGYAKSFDN
ncbi:MAG: hypothetical protein WCR71_07220 [Bacteroidales bacterium]